MADVRVFSFLHKTGNFRIKVTVKVTRSLTLLSFKRVSLVEYACQE